MLETLTRWDSALFTRINQQWTNGVFDIFMPLVSETALFWLLLVPVLAALVWRARKDGARLRRLARKLLFVALCVLFANLATDAVKSLRLRTRPLNTLPHARYVDDGGQWQNRPEYFIAKSDRGTSFFSGHAANTMALAGGLALAFPPSAPAVFVLPLAVGYSRVYLAKHYPGDVLMGWFCGWLSAWGLGRLVRRRGWLP